MKLTMPVGLDMGSSGVKCMSTSEKQCFPSVITTLKSNMWNEKESKGNIKIGLDAVKSGKSYGSKCVFPISSGRPIDVEGYAMLAQYALRNIGITNISKSNYTAVSSVESHKDTGMTKISDVCLVVGLPYDAIQQIPQIKSIFNSKIGVGKCIIETQARGTLRSMNLTTGIILNIGFGTTEAVIFDENRAVEGDSLRCAINTILEGVNTANGVIEKISFTDVAMFNKFEKESRPYAAEIADEISRWYHEKTLRAKHEYPVVISGGGILNNTVYSALKKTDMEFTVPQDPLYSNVLGHFMRAKDSC